MQLEIYINVKICRYTSTIEDNFSFNFCEFTTTKQRLSLKILGSTSFVNLRYLSAHHFDSSYCVAWVNQTVGRRVCGAPIDLIRIFFVFFLIINFTCWLKEKHHLLYWKYIAFYNYVNIFIACFAVFNWWACERGWELYCWI